MNTPPKNTEMEMCRSSLYIIESGNQIIRQLQESARGFETFFSLLSHAVWQSPLELAEAWIYMVAKEDYMILLEPLEDREMERIKTQIRKNILGFVSEKIRIFYENPSFLQQMKSRFLVLHTLAHELPPADHDRIIAKQMGIPYGTWQRMLGLFSHNPKFLEIMRLPNTGLWEWGTHSWESGYILSAPEGNHEQISSIGSIPGIEVGEQFNAELDVAPNGELIFRSVKSPVLFINETVLRRYEQVIGMEKERSDIRIAIYNRFEEIPVWKKRFDGGGSSRREPTPKLAPKGVF